MRAYALKRAFLVPWKNAKLKRIFSLDEWFGLMNFEVIS